MAGKVFTIELACLLSLFALAAPAANSPDLRLVKAIKDNDRKAAQSLIRQHVDVNAPEADGATPLAWAAHWDDLETADLLIQAGANANAANDYGVAPLHLACVNGSAPMVEKLLKAGADANAVESSGDTVLMICARTGNPAAVQLLLDHGADVNAKEASKGQTALMWALAEKHPEVARLLIEHKADVRAKTKGGFTPLLFAAQQGDLDSARLLIQAGADVNESTPNQMTPLLIATASGQRAVAALFVEQGADVNATDARGFTVLHYAAQNRNMTDLIKALLAHHANPNPRLTRNPGGGDEEGALSLAGATPFLLAAAGGNSAAMRALAEGGADPNIPTKDGTTPLMIAAGVGKYEDRGPAQTRSALECVKVALDLGADVNATGANGWTALHGAAYTGSDAIIQLLVSKGAKLDAKDRFGQTPLSIAEAVVTRGLGENADVRPRRYRKSTVDALLKLGATPTAQAGVDAVGSM